MQWTFHSHNYGEVAATIEWANLVCNTQPQSLYASYTILWCTRCCSILGKLFVLRVALVYDIKITCLSTAWEDWASPKGLKGILQRAQKFMLLVSSSNTTTEQLYMWKHDLEILINRLKLKVQRRFCLYRRCATYNCISRQRSPQQRGVAPASCPWVFNRCINSIAAASDMLNKQINRSIW